MGLLGKLVDDVFDAAEKIVRAPGRLVCAVDEHDWRWSRERGCYVCQLCAATADNDADD
jgi:hypothetical protein